MEQFGYFLFGSMIGLIFFVGAILGAFLLYVVFNVIISSTPEEFFKGVCNIAIPVLFIIGVVYGFSFKLFAFIGAFLLFSALFPFDFVK